MNTIAYNILPLEVNKTQKRVFQLVRIERKLPKARAIHIKNDEENMCQNVNTIIRAMCESLPILKHCRCCCRLPFVVDDDFRHRQSVTFPPNVCRLCHCEHIRDSLAAKRPLPQSIFIVANFCLLLSILFFFFSLHPISKCVILHIWFSTSNNINLCISSDKYATKNCWANIQFHSLFVTSDALQHRKIRSLSQSQSVVHPLSTVFCCCFFLPKYFICWKLPSLVDSFCLFIFLKTVCSHNMALF